MMRQPEIDALIAERDTYRKAWERERANVDKLTRQLNLLKAQVGKPDILYAVDILAGAGIMRPTLDKWKERYPDFPKPIPDTWPFEYRRVEVLRWLEDHGRKWIEPGEALSSAK